MSFKLYMLQTLGKIKPTEKIEAERQSLLTDYLEFIKVEKSEELKDFLELEDYVNSSAFSEKKKEIEVRVFKGSTEFNQLNEFLKLSKAKHIKNFFIAEKSDSLKRFENFKNSEKLADYYKLKDYIDDGEHQKEKTELKKQVFRGSVEGNHFLEYKKLEKSKALKAYLELEGSSILKDHEAFTNSKKLKRFITLKDSNGKSKEEIKELKSLKNDSQIKKYFRFEKSQKLKYFHEIGGSHTLVRYIELKGMINSEEFKTKRAWLEDKRKYEKSEAHKKYTRYKQLASDGDVKFFLLYEKSKIYKNYLDVKDSFDLKRYNELKELTESGEFLKRKVYLEDTKKWEKTEEFAKQQKCFEMKKLPHLLRYFKYKGGNAFDFFYKWETVFEDGFDSGLDKEKWSTRSYWAHKLVNENFSQPGDLQCYTDGNNVITGKKGCLLQVRKERAQGKYWNPAAGFTPEEFQYTSGQLCSGNSFWFEDGIIEAKVKFNPVKEIASMFHLLGEKASPQLNIVEMGTKNRLGVLQNNNGKIDFEGVSIGNLKKGKYYIFSIEKTASHIIWKINEQVLFEIPVGSIEFPLHLNLASLVVNEVSASKLPAGFEIAWVKCYRRK
ncbi:MAG: hypothetical protein HQ541_20295 [Mariniphaga sp.]|nr:hypothetical protein [Mariniphaga sp.]